MSRMSYLEAIESVLNRELEERSELLALRPGARRALEEAERDIALPRMGRTEFSIAVGASLAGMHPALDLRQENDCANLLLDALCGLPAGTMPEMTVITGAEDADVLAEIPGVLTLYPKTPRQAAGFTRAALRSSRMTLLIADRSLYDEEDDVPEDDDFMLLPLDADMSDEAGEEDTDLQDEPAVLQDIYEGTSGEDDAQPEIAEETAEEVAEPEPDSADAEAPDVEKAEECVESREERRMSFCASRMTACDLTKLRNLAGELEMPEPLLIEKCMAHACSGRTRPEWRYDAEATAGEAAFLPPESGGISLWLGWDVLTASYDAAAVDDAEAAGLMRAVRRVLERPNLLIYDKERDKR